MTIAKVFYLPLMGLQVLNFLFDKVLQNPTNSQGRDLVVLIGIIGGTITMFLVLIPLIGALSAYLVTIVVAGLLEFLFLAKRFSL